MRHGEGDMPEVSLSISADVVCPHCQAEMDLVVYMGETADPAFSLFLKNWLSWETSQLTVECPCGKEFQVSTNEVAW